MKKYDSENSSSNKSNIDSLSSNLSKLRMEVKKLSYEEATTYLEELLKNLQDDSISVEELQLSYMKGKIYLEHCENLLSSFEQEILEIDPESLTE